MINPEALLAKRAGLKSVANEVAAGESQREQQRRTIEEEKVTQLQKIRAVTKLDTEAERVQYYLDGGIDAWIDEMRANLNSDTTMDAVTFATSVVEFTKLEKQQVHSHIAETFRADNVDKFGNEDLASEACINYVENELKQDYFEFLEDKVAMLRARVNQDPKLDALRARLDTVIREKHGGVAFVKLSTRSPKDSFGALCAARREVQSFRKGSKAEGNADMNSLFVRFTEQVRLHLCVQNGHEALHLLADSIRVWEDLDTDVVETDSDKITLIVRTFDKRIIPSTEWRGFVWNKKFVCAGQYFYPFFFEELNASLEFPQADELKKKIENALREFYDQVMAPSIPHFLQKTPCFLMDLVYLEGTTTEETGNGRVLLTEINPFDGEAIGVFKGSTGLFSWDCSKDRALMMGERTFELRVQGKKIITDGRKNQADMANMSPLWIKGLYG